MSPTVRHALTGAAALFGAALLSPTVAAADFAPQPTPQPAVTGTLEVTCTQDIPVPTVIVAADNPTAWAQPVSLVRNGIIHTGFAVDAGSDEHEVIADVAWEDKDNHFQLVSNGNVLAEVHHHFDCLHPIISVAIDNPCADVPVPVVITNSGHEGTHVTVTVDGAVVAEPPVAPGHSTQVDVTADVGTVVAVHHQGTLEAEAELVACSTGPAPERPRGDDHTERPTAGDDRPNRQPGTDRDDPDRQPGHHDPEPERPTGRPRTDRAAVDVPRPDHLAGSPATTGAAPRYPEVSAAMNPAAPYPEPSEATPPASPSDPDPVPGGLALLLAGLAPLAATGARRALG